MEMEIVDGRFTSWTSDEMRRGGLVWVEVVESIVIARVFGTVYSMISSLFATSPQHIVAQASRICPMINWP